MSGRAEQGAGKLPTDNSERRRSAARVTIFSLPKPFSDPAICRIQANAIRSWLAIDEQVEVLLLGNEQGIEAFASEVGARHCGEIESNAHGTPLVSSAFEQANRLASGDYLLYCNADVILRGEIVGLADKLGQKWPSGFLAIGRRNEVCLSEELDWSKREQVNQTLDEAYHRSHKAARVCKEYFLFRRGQFSTIPAFAVGRGNWDNWMVSHSRRTGIPVVDVGPRVRALHQAHGYSHLASEAKGQPSRWNCYVAGDEARANEKLAGGKCLIRGCSTDWLVDTNGRMSQKWLGSWNRDFWLDLPRFLAMSVRLPFQR
ncbi:MAG: hypothetical protein ACKO9H_09235 [Planctomycetota bacterium]